MPKTPPPTPPPFLAPYGILIDPVKITSVSDWCLSEMDLQGWVNFFMSCATSRTNYYGGGCVVRLDDDSRKHDPMSNEIPFFYILFISLKPNDEHDTGLVKCHYKLISL